MTYVRRQEAVPAPPKVSVIVPVFDTEQYLPDCLSSLLCQSLAEIEIIIVDDGARGDVEQIVRGTAGYDFRVRVIKHQLNQGTLAARLSGAEAAIGTYIAFVDPDDLVGDRFLEVLYSAAKQNDADLVQCPITVIEEDGRVWSLDHGGTRHSVRGDRIITEFLSGTIANSVANKLIRASCWQGATGHLKMLQKKMTLGEDLLVLFHIVCKSGLLVNARESSYYYIRRRNSVTDRSGDLITDITFVLEYICGSPEFRAQPDDLREEFLRRQILGVPGIHLHEPSLRALKEYAEHVAWSGYAHTKIPAARGEPVIGDANRILAKLLIAQQSLSGTKQENADLRHQIALLKAEAQDLRQALDIFLPFSASEPDKVAIAMWQSRSWRMTRLLRNLRLLRSGGDRESLRAIATWAEAAEVVSSIYQSSSWELTGPFRAIFRLIRERRGRRGFHRIEKIPRRDVMP